jgi:hypothetical protein
LKAGLAHPAHDAAAGASDSSGEPNAAPAPAGTPDANRADSARPEAQSGVDFDEQGDPEAGEDESGAEAHVDSIQGKFLRLVNERLKYELSRKIPALEKKWLLESLELDEYWLGRSQASHVLRKLGAEIADFDSSGLDSLGARYCVGTWCGQLVSYKNLKRDITPLRLFGLSQPVCVLSQTLSYDYVCFKAA